MDRPPPHASSKPFSALSSQKPSSQQQPAQQSQSPPVPPTQPKKAPSFLTLLKGSGKGKGGGGGGGGDGSGGTSSSSGSGGSVFSSTATESSGGSTVVGENGTGGVLGLTGTEHPVGTGEFGQRKESVGPSGLSFVVNREKTWSGQQQSPTVVKFAPTPAQPSKPQQSFSSSSASSDDPNFQTTGLDSPIDVLTKAIPIPHSNSNPPTKSSPQSFSKKLGSAYTKFHSPKSSLSNTPLSSSPKDQPLVGNKNDGISSGKNENSNTNRPRSGSDFFVNSASASGSNSVKTTTSESPSTPKPLFSSSLGKKQASVDSVGSQVSSNGSTTTTTAKDRDKDKDVQRTFGFSPFSSKHQHQPLPDEPKHSNQASAKNSKSNSTLSSSSAGSKTLEETRALASKRMDRIGYAAPLVDALVVAGKVASFVPYLGEATTLVSSIYAAVQGVGSSEVAAWRMVGRCIHIVETVQDLALKGNVPDEMNDNLKQLIGSLHTAELAITSLAGKNWLQLYLRSDELNGLIARANEELEDSARIFQIQAAVQTALWQKHNDEDRKKDTQKILSQIKDSEKSDEATLQLMQVRQDEMLETIRTLQKTLDAVLEAKQLQQGLPQVAKDAAISYMKVKVDTAQPDGHLARLASTSDAPKPRIRAAVRPILVSKDSLSLTDPTTSPVSFLEPPVARLRRAAWTAIAAKRLAHTPPDQIDAHIHFLKRGLEVLLRRSGGESDLPDWTISPLELTYLSKDSSDGSGFYSKIYKAEWKDQIVAVKKLNSSVPRNSFLNEVSVWSKVSHENILQFWGASSTTADPPYILVSPWIDRGNVLDFLKTPESQGYNRYKWILEVASAMAFLRSRLIVHGDIKANNVLISLNGTALVCDFGLSQLKAEIARLSRDRGEEPPSRGNVRWSAPELLDGEEPSYVSDVYAWAVTVTEIFTERVPFGLSMTDSTIRETVINKKSRPTLSGIHSNPLKAVICQAWHQDPHARPSFENLLPVLDRFAHGSMDDASTSSSVTSEDYTTANSRSATPDNRPDVQDVVSPHRSDIDLPGTGSSSSTTSSSHVFPDPEPEDRMVTLDDSAAKSYRRNMRERFLDDRFSTPLFSPSAVDLGDIGYISNGAFVRLYNAIEGPSGIKVGLQSALDEFGTLTLERKAVITRSATERGLEVISNLLTKFRRSSGETSKKLISREIVFPLESPGHKKLAGLYVDEAELLIFHQIDFAAKYLSENIDAILAAYQTVVPELKKEAIILVVGTIAATDWALFVANADRHCNLSFNVHAQKKLGEEWGTWTTAVSESSHGRDEFDSQPKPFVSCRVSKTGPIKDAVLLARLRIPAGSNKPTLID